MEGGDGRGWGRPAVLGEEMRLPEERLSADEGPPEGSLGQAVEPAAMPPLPAQKRTPRGAGVCVMWCGALRLIVLLARVSLGMCVGGPHADGVPGARTPQALLRFPRS